MEQNSNYITVEITFRASMKDYRLVLGMKRAWIVALFVGLIQLATWLIKNFIPF